MKLTLGEAAKTVGASKPTLSKALKNGALSAEKNDDGSYAIDPAELTRWNETRSKRNTKNRSKTVQQADEATPTTLSMLKENATLQARLEVLEAERERERHSFEKQIDKLESRLDDAEERWRETEARRHDLEKLLLPPPQKPVQGGNGFFGWFGRAKA